MGESMETQIEVEANRWTAPRPFFERLEARSREIDSLLCVGLDAHPALLKSPDPEGALAFCQEMVEATADAACAFKVNRASSRPWAPKALAPCKRS
jgi:orotidine-5'-phosphate decarboxylase